MVSQASSYVCVCAWTSILTGQSQYHGDFEVAHSSTGGHLRLICDVGTPVIWIYCYIGMGFD